MQIEKFALYAFKLSLHRNIVYENVQRSIVLENKKPNIFLRFFFFFFCQKNREVKKSGQNSELQYQFLLPFAFFRNDPLKLIIMWLWMMYMENCCIQQDAYYNRKQVFSIVPQYCSSLLGKVHKGQLWKLRGWTECNHFFHSDKGRLLYSVVPHFCCRCSNVWMVILVWMEAPGDPSSVTLGVCWSTEQT